MSVPEGLHAALGVVDDQDLFHPQPVMGDQQGPDDILGHDAARVANDISIARLQPEGLFQRDTVIHAGDNGKLADDRGRGPARIVSPRELAVRAEDII